MNNDFKKKLPIGEEDFKFIRQQGFFYIDKTLLIRDLLNGSGKVNLFTRPRRFGKTLNMSMLREFFDINGDQSIFEGLAIMNEKAMCDEYMGKFPVVFVSLKSVEGLTFDDAKQRLRSVIREEASKFEYLCQSEKVFDSDKNLFYRIIREEDSPNDIIDSIKLLTRMLNRYYSKNVIVLIDEYDVPLDKANKYGYYNEMVSLIRSMFNQGLKTNDYLHFAVLTGCLRISKESIFTGLNNPKVFSIADENFDEYFGFTESEVDEILEYYKLQNHKSEIKEWYDGYHFGLQDVYCPWDVINYCYDLITTQRARIKSYWINTSGNDMVRHLIDKSSTATQQAEIEQLIEGKAIRKTINDKLTYNEIDDNINNIWSLLYMTGYLTTTEFPTSDDYDLIIPNKEIKQIFTEQVLKWFKDKAATKSNNYKELFDAFASGDAVKIKEILDELLLDTISFHDAYESFYHGFLIALLSTCATWQVTSNLETGKGRSDILVESVDKKLGFVIEVKEARDGKLDEACERAIKQIEEKDYTAFLRKYRYKSIIEYGIAFHDKECCVIAKKLS